MRISICILILFCSLSSQAQRNNQIRIQSVNTNSKEFSSLRPGRVHIENIYNNDVSIEYSDDNKKWQNTIIKQYSGIIATINISKQYLYVRITHSDRSNAIYKLRPKHRYTLQYSEEFKGLIVVEQ